MGVYLSQPIVEKISADKTCQHISYGASSMQGWRMTQEDSHNCLDEFDPDTGTSLFAVYDGHGGAEVAQYCKLYLPDFIKSRSAYPEGRLAQSMENAFLEFDATLVQEKVIQELKMMAGVDEDGEEEEGAGIPVGKTEADMLREEAVMPLNELLAKYDGVSVLPPGTKDQLKKENIQSPALRAKQSSSSVENGSGDASISRQMARDDDIVKCLDQNLANGHADNENNLNTEKEINAIANKTSSICEPCESEARQSNGHLAVNEGKSQMKDVTQSADAGSSVETKMDNDVSCGRQHADSSISCSNDSPERKQEPSSSSSTNAGGSRANSDQEPTSSAEAGGTPSCTSADTENQELAGNVSSSKSAGISSSGGSFRAAEGSCSSSVGSSSSPGSSSAAGSSIAVGSSSAAGSSSSAGGSSSEEPSSSGTSFGLNMLYDDDDDDSDETSEEESDDDSEEDEDEQEDGEGMGPMEPIRDPEEPGADSGCTAVVALIRDRELYVANAGDSRCVLCRAGKAVDLSNDHKPEDEAERKRIENAGGNVTISGRVNGGLNLSRAIGDHYYKRNAELPDRDQMITALPDVQSITLTDDDEFMVLACDGIWNFLSSQEVVTFVKERFKDPTKRNQPSLVCEEMFDHCLAPDTMGDGTGCDNMTCIIVTFDSTYKPNQTKRNASEMEKSTDEDPDKQAEKKQKVETESD